MKRTINFWLCGVLIVATISACSDRAKLERDVKLIHSSPIDLCMDSLYRYCTNEGANSEQSVVVDTVEVGKLSLVIYSDETVCSSCAVKGMYVWNELIDSTKNRYGDSLPFYFIFTPEKEQLVDLKIALKRSGFDYPVYIDTLGVFKQRNRHIPKNKLLHTFLLDSDRKVVLVGSPLSNYAIMQMFYQIADSCLIR
ncbi:MAG: hypothetical protein E7071_05780 [Bacteroidales bacterium]|nr:hypothetical protein [Bacteroidales bacterium]